MKKYLKLNLSGSPEDYHEEEENTGHKRRRGTKSEPNFINFQSFLEHNQKQLFIHGHTAIETTSMGTQKRIIDVGIQNQGKTVGEDEHCYQTVTVNLEALGLLVSEISNFL